MTVKRGVRYVLAALAAYVLGGLLYVGSGLVWSNPPDVVTALALLLVLVGVLALLAGVVVLLGAAWKWSRR